MNISNISDSNGNSSDIFVRSIKDLHTFIEKNGWEGYDPYDGLNSKFTSSISRNSKLLRLLIIHSNKSFPINLRNILKIEKGISNKGMGLFASAFLKLYKVTNDIRFLEAARFCLDYLKTKSLKERYCNNNCWTGAYYLWQSSGEGNITTIEVPSIISTVTCASAFLEDYELTKADESLEIAKSAADFVIETLYVNSDGKPYFKYVPGEEPNSHVYNASTHGVMLLSYINKYIEDNRKLEIAKKVTDYVISRQKPNGAWYYSETNGKEKKQIDFHQGFILDDLFGYVKYVQPSDDRYMKALVKGAEFYKNEQFLPDGRAKWRWPRVYPVDIHNQAQGIITFSKLSEIKSEYLDFARDIAKWTIENMQDETGYFYYQKWPFFVNKIPYMRWGQAWMMFALSSLLEKCGNSWSI